MRLFIAIALDDETGAVLERVRQEWSGSSEGLRWSRPSDRHLTLQFLGEVAADVEACLTDALAGVRSRQVPVRIDGTGCFLRAGVFWAGVELSPELLALQQKVCAATRACGIIPEPRPYRPHITLARSRGHRGGAALAALQKAAERGRLPVRSEYVAREFALYDSSPSPEGSRYEVRRRFPLE